MDAAEKLLGSLLFHFPPGPGWRAIVPLLATAWAITFGVVAPLAVWHLRSWSHPPLRRAAILMWLALLPTVAVTGEYVVRVLVRVPDRPVAPLFAFVANVVAPFWVVKSFLLVGPTARPASFQVARAIGTLAWSGAWTLWLGMSWIACITV